MFQVFFMNGADIQILLIVYKIPSLVGKECSRRWGREVKREQNRNSAMRETWQVWLQGPSISGFSSAGTKKSETGTRKSYFWL